jgi:hypothetical protein
MNFPKRIKQHKAQSDSFAILLYKLRDVGIFRSATENDYGIDFEIEIVHEDQVIGKFLKAQVKSSEEVYIREDGRPTVSGIKQSTLLYWTQLSYSTHVVVFAVDITTEKIYYTKSVFWQATALFDKTEATKTIVFLPSFDQQPDSAQTKEQHAHMENFITGLLIKQVAFSYSIPDILNAHKTVLRNLNEIFELYTDTWHYDHHTEVQSVSVFKLLLDCCDVLFELPENVEDLTDEEKKNFFKFEYWEQATGWMDDQVRNYIAQKPLKIIMPLLLDALELYNKRILDAAYYWKRQDWPYLKIVQSIKLPTERVHESLIRLDYERYNFYGNRDVNYYHKID